jgi:hypothetical protein
VEARQYPLRQGQGYFEVGVATDGSQILIAHTVSDLFVFRFNRQGKYLGRETVTMDVSPPRHPGSGVVMADAAYWDQVQSEIEAVKRRIGFSPGDILIQKFSDDEVYAGIDDLPGEYEQFLQSPESADEADRAAMEDAIREWRAAGWYVLVFWGGEYWMSAEGEVLSHD